MGQSLAAKNGQTVFTWWLHTSGVTYNATPLRVSLGDGTDTLLTISTGGVGVANGSNFISEFQTLATANRTILLADSSGTLFPETVLITTADFSNSTVTPTMVTNLAFTCAPSTTYEFEGILLVQSASTAVMPKISLTGPGETAWVIYETRFLSSLSGAGTNEFIMASVAWSAGGSIVTNNTVMPVANTNCIMRVSGRFRTTSSQPTSPFAIYLQSGTAATAVKVMADSGLRIRKIR